MALPKLNESPSYTVTIPSSGQETSFRPFLVKEQKALLIAYETQDKQDMVRSIIRTIHACVEDPIDTKLTTFDVDYLFTKIRAKSVGETADVQTKCSECDTTNEINIELDNIVLEGDVDAKTIELTDSVSVEMRFPTYEEFLKNPVLNEEGTMTEGLVELLITCMDAVLTEEERVVLSDEPREAIVEFIDSMTAAQFEKVAEFVNTMPAISQEVEFTCQSCGHVNTRVLKGMDDFF